MTRAPQKQEECIFAMTAANLLGVQWKLIPCDQSSGGPDFIVREDSNWFVLEVCQIFKGGISKKKGSILKEKAARTQQLIDDIREMYESAAGNVPLYVRFLCDIDEDDKHEIFQKLLDMNLKEKSFPYSEDLDWMHGSRSLKISVKRLPDDFGRDRMPRRDWFNINDSIGTVEKNSSKILKTIKKKSKKIANYKNYVANVANVAYEMGLEDPENCKIRLLIVADHTWSCGFVNPKIDRGINLRGFDDVYFFPYPDEKPRKLRGYNVLEWNSFLVSYLAGAIWRRVASPRA